MTTKSIGSTSLNPIQVPSYTVQSKITSFQNNNNIASIARLIKPTPAPTPTKIVTGRVTGIPDAPGFVKLPFLSFFTPAQNTALRSAAKNTAQAFELDQIIEPDRAEREQRKLIDYTLSQAVPPTTDETIVPD